jgi:hypothetical protein
VDLLGGDLLADDAVAPAPAPAAAAPPVAAGIDDLLGGMSLGGGGGAAAAASSPIAAAAAAASRPAAADPFDLLGGDLGAPAAVPAAAPASALPLLLAADKGRGLTVRGAVVRAGGSPAYSLSLHNGSAAPLDGFMLQLNSNAFGLAPGNQVVAVGTLAPGASGAAAVPLAFNAAKLTAGAAAPRLQVRRRRGIAGCGRGRAGRRGAPASNPPINPCMLVAAVANPPPPPRRLPPPAHRHQVALKTNQLGVFYWDDALPLAAVTEEDGTIDGGAFLNAWRGLGAEATQRLEATVSDVDAVKAKLGAARLFVLANRPVSGGRARAAGVFDAHVRPRIAQTVHSQAPPSVARRRPHLSAPPAPALPP